MLTDMGCRNLKPQAKPVKKSDAGGLYLLVKPGGSKHWHMGYRFGGKQKKLSFGPYPIVTLIGARDKRDAAKRLLADGIDPGVAKQVAKREQAAARPFGTWADEWLERSATSWTKRRWPGRSGTSAVSRASSATA
jgi:hypothetical protein